MSIVVVSSLARPASVATPGDDAARGAPALAGASGLDFASVRSDCRRVPRSPAAKRRPERDSDLAEESPPAIDPQLLMLGLTLPIRAYPDDAGRGADGALPRQAASC